jgi:hypothetical protein
MSLILRRSLIFLMLLAGGLVLYSLWYGIKADRYEQTAIPYIDSVMPALTSWQPEQLIPVLSPQAKAEFANEKLRAAYRLLGRLGQFQAMEKPRFIASIADSSEQLGDVELVDYEVEVRFDSGPALLKIRLVADGHSYHVRRFGFHSEIFAAGSSGAAGE